MIKAELIIVEVQLALGLFVMKMVKFNIKEKKVLYLANVGDTRSVLLTDNNCERISYDHKTSDLNE